MGTSTMCMEDRSLYKDSTGARKSIPRVWIQMEPRVGRTIHYPAWPQVRRLRQSGRRNPVVNAHNGLPLFHVKLTTELLRIFNEPLPVFARVMSRMTQSSIRCGIAANG